MPDKKLDIEFYIRNKLTGKVHPVPRHSVDKILIMAFELDNSVELVKVEPLENNEINELCSKYRRQDA